MIFKTTVATKTCTRYTCDSSPVKKSYVLDVGFFLTNEVSLLSVIQYLFSCLGKISERRDFLILNFKNDLKIRLSEKDISFLSCIHFASHIQEPCVL